MNRLSPEAGHEEAMTEESQTATPLDGSSVIQYGSDARTVLRITSIDQLTKLERLIILGSKVVSREEVAEFVERMRRAELRTEGVKWLGGGGLICVMGGGILAATYSLVGGLPLIFVGAALAGSALVMSGGSDPTMKEFQELLTATRKPYIKRWRRLLILPKKALQQANISLDLISRTDGLTQLLNRRAWEEEMHHEFKRSSRSHHSSTLVMFDIDHFKLVNDTYGHQAGDEVIKRVADIVRETKRECDIAGRYGGEEYCIVLLDTDSQGGLIYAERLRKAIAATPVVYEDFSIDFTISLGISEINEKMKGAKVWLEQADQALYQSKESGRNKSTIYSKPGPKAADNGKRPIDCRCHNELAVNEYSIRTEFLAFWV